MQRTLLSDDSDEEFQENQLKKLKNTYRHAHDDQREFTIEKKDQLRSQSKALQLLTREREELDKMLRLAESLENQKRDEAKTKKLQELVRTKDEILSNIENEKLESNEFDSQIRKLQTQINEKQIEVGGANVATTFNATIRKQERVLENRLDTALKRFNSLLTTNNVLRSEIDNLRNERERFENLSNKSEVELKNFRVQLIECIEQSVTAYEQRKDANNKAINLQNKAENDKSTAEAEMKELERQISHDRKLHDFMKRKLQERQEDEELVTHRKLKEAEAAEKRRKEREEHSVEAYESKFKRIQEICHEEDLNKFVDKFIEVEDKNFALFNYVNELNGQIETLQEQIADIKKEIRRFEAQGLELEDQRKRILAQIEDKRIQKTAAADENQEKFRSLTKILDQCRAGINSLFKKIGCDRRQIDHLLQSQGGVTEDHMLRYLGIIEERTNELLTAQAMIAAKEQNMTVRDRAPNLIGDGPLGPAPIVQVHLPNTDDRRDQEEKEDRTEEDLKPLTREELKQRAIDHVKSLERKALQEQSKYPDLQPTASREKSTVVTSRTGGGETGKLPGSRGR